MAKTLNLQNAVQRSASQTLIRSRKAHSAMLRLQADDGDTSDRDTLKVLNDGDGVKLLMSIYQDYVSDDDYVKFPKFMADVDNLLYKARGNRTLTREERDEMLEAAPPKRGKKKKKPAEDAPPPADANAGAPTDSGTIIQASNTNAYARHLTNHIRKSRARMAA